MPGIEETMGGNSHSFTSKEVNLEVNETLPVEPVPLPQRNDTCNQGVEKEDGILCKNLKKKLRSRKVHSAKRSCPARFAKEIPFKRFKEESLFQHPQTVPDAFKLPKTEKASGVLDQCQESDEMLLGEFDQEVKLPLPRRYFYKPRCKSISKYWQSVERYCRPITKNDVKFLHQLIAKQEHSEAMCYNIPPLGEHYTRRWATKDLADEETASNPNKTRQRAIAPSPSSALNLLKLGDENLKSNPLKPETTSHSLQSFLTQNLNKILEEDKEKSRLEKFELNSNEVELDSRDSDSRDSLFPTKVSKENNGMLYGGASSLESMNLTLESRLKRDLEGIGIRNLDEHMREDDEIVVEMKRCIAQINALGTNNIIQLKRCLKLAEDEMKKQELRQKLRICDSEIVVIHQKIQMSKQKKDCANKRDRDLAWKLLKNREALIKEMDAFNS